MAQVYDFTEFKLHALMESYARSSQFELANALADVLDGYLLGQLQIEWSEGLPLVINVTEA